LRSSPRMIVTRPAILLFASALASCVQPPAPSESALSRELVGRTAGAPQSCITTVSSGVLNAVDSTTLAYHSGTTIYLNHPDGPCSALAPLNTLIIDAQAGHYCRGDRVRGIEYGGGIPGPVCILGDWIAYRKP